MSKVERKEYQETKIMRTVSPVRNIRTSNQNLTEFDHNLDYLLEDLQNSVSRPGSSLGTYRETSKTLDSTRSNSLNRFSNVKASNPMTEYSSDDAYSYTSPDGTKKIKGFKKESYSYKTSGGIAPPPEKVRMQNSINQLDSLLDDLQQVKNSSFLKEESYNNSGINPDAHKNTVNSKRTVQRELHYGDTPRSSSKTRSLERSERENSLTREIQYSNEGTYGDLRQIRASSPTPSSRTSTLSKQAKVTNVHTYPVEVVETTSPEIDPEVLSHLDPALHPPGNTKVTTTIKTYTYEIPGSGNYPTNLVDTSVDSEKSVYSLNQSQTTPSKSFVYKKVENKLAENRVNYPPEPTWENKEYRESSDKITRYTKPPSPGFKETVTIRNYQPGYSPEITPPSNQTYVYNETTTTRNYDGSLPRKQNPPQQTYIIEEKHNTITNRNIGHPYPDERDHPRPNPPRQESYLVKEYHDTNTTTNVHHPPLNGYPTNEPNKTVIYKHESHTTNKYDYGDRPGDVEKIPKHPPYPNDNRGPNEPINIKYKYTSERTTTNNYKAGYPPGDESQPLLPRPFPTNASQEGPPKKLDKLLETFGEGPPDSPYNAGFKAHEQEIQQRKKIETLKRQQEEAEQDAQKKEPIQRSKNVSGPPVYYPPGHEMFAKKEESGAAWRAEGAYARGAGKYEYEAESKSKSKSSSGAAIVPVCLPLCCGLPCTIL